MKNKKGFTLVELLAVIVILALIMGVAIVGIGNVISKSKNDVMFENALSIISGVKKQFAINNVDPNGKVYGFNASILESGGVTSPLGGSFNYGSEVAANKVVTGLWQITTSPPSSCAATTPSYISVSSSGVYTICLTAGANQKWIYGTENELSAQNANTNIYPTPAS